MKKVSIIVPCYNVEKYIERCLNSLINQEYKNIEILCIDDGSKDNTKEIIENFLEKDKRIQYFYKENGGLSSVIQLGFKYALKYDYDAVVQFDGDGQHHAKYIDEMVKELEKGNDIVIGSRYVTKKKPFSLRMIGSRIISFLIKITTGKTINDPTSGFRIYSKKLIPEFANYINYPPEPDCLVYLLRRKFRIKEVQVEMSEREFGTSYLNAFKSFEYMLRICVSILFIQLFRRK